jgi:hypothetical protein
MIIKVIVCPVKEEIKNTEKSTIGHLLQQIRYKITKSIKGDIITTTETGMEKKKHYSNTHTKLKNDNSYIILTQK